MTNYRKAVNIIRKSGAPMEATTIWGWKAYRSEVLYAPEPYDTLFPCLDYRNHFVYEVPLELTMKNPKIYGNFTPAFMCTCGSAAGVIGVDAYKHDASPQGFVFACMFHNNIVNPKTGEIHGKHADGSIGG